MVVGIYGESAVIGISRVNSIDWENYQQTHKPMGYVIVVSTFYSSMTNGVRILARTVKCDSALH